MFKLRNRGANSKIFFQLQQINFMGLMHMVGSTFASLPYMQLAQSNTLPSHPSAAPPAPFSPSQPNTLFPPVQTNAYGQLPTQARVPLRSEHGDVLPNLASVYNTSDRPSTSRNYPGHVGSAEVNPRICTVSLFVCGFVVEWLYIYLVCVLISSTLNSLSAKNYFFFVIMKIDTNTPCV